MEILCAMKQVLWHQLISHINRKICHKEYSQTTL